MPNITISLDKDLIEAGRQYAKEHHTSINALIRRLLEHTVRPQSSQWLGECFQKMDQAKMNSRGKRWCREELYDV